MILVGVPDARSSLAERRSSERAGANDQDSGVEDERDVRELLVDLLEDAGYEVVVATNGGAAL